MKKPKRGELGRGISQKLTDFDIWLKSERLSENTIRRYLERARRFMVETGDKPEYDMQDARKFLAEIKGTGNWARFNYYVLKIFFVAMGWGDKWDMRRPPKETEYPKQPSLSAEDIGRLIQAARRGKLTPREAGLVAISTIYGPRRVELANLGRGCINFENRTITILTAKHGRRRTHLIPPEIFPYIERFDFRAYGTSALDYQFIAVMRKCGIKHEDGMGWHSIRRRLSTEMKRNKIIYRKEFLRWKLKGMDDVYDVATPEEIDRAVFAEHPFLEAWR